MHGTTKKRSRDYSRPTLRLSAGLLGCCAEVSEAMIFVGISVD
ncbi:hypothetical protein PAMC26510_31005 [Caballeronia sordidicola]|uniref:Uncharacterized protein n=1 Tax=Caballeronia sordidicola TaxID=196367 RepID=A0A242N7R8_CABSO|nr:hypothetical protein PAMC26510_31005 [Caballeronia sordidicola]OTP79697.1 hypothetical protein PAMC26577_00210 [Caballeronia sordidicola]